MQVIRALFYVSLPTLPFSAIAATPQLQKWFPWLSFWFLVAGVAVFFLVVGMWWDYVVMLPSEMAYNNKQSYKHENPYVTDMNAVKRSQIETERRLTEMERSQVMNQIETERRLNDIATTLQELAKKV
jgi:hypothetical protein